MSFSGTTKSAGLNRTLLAAPLIHPHRAALPVLLSIPHSGRDYPSWLLANSAGGRPALESLEDPLVDRLAWRLISRGIGAVVARAPRAAIDCNRAVNEVDPAVVVDCGGESVGPRARGGLGIVPGRTAPHGRLWRRPIDQAELDRRIAEAHAPYHDALHGELERLGVLHGWALLVDCHSMPRRRGQPDLVIGDRHGSSAAPWLAGEAARLARAGGWSAALNDPYAGGHIVERHGRPDRNIHALQIEIDRSRYLRPGERDPGPGFDQAARMLETLVLGLAAAQSVPDAIAAE